MPLYETANAYLINHPLMNTESVSIYHTYKSCHFEHLCPNPWLFHLDKFLEEQFIELNYMYVFDAPDNIAKLLSTN
jgi:hypothetical protein